MDPASNTIDRHAPIIPESIWQGLPPDQERTYALIKNTIILPNSPIAKLNSSRKQRLTAQRAISDDQLAEGRAALTQDILPDNWITLLHARGVTDAEIRQYQMQDTQTLVSKLRPETIHSLTLQLPPQLPTPHEIAGISVPIFAQDLFMGFATRIYNNPNVKYAFSIPYRLCFGHDPTAPEVWVCEGIFDAIALRRIGLNPLGIGDSQPNYFKLLQASRHRMVHLLFDDDLAGAMGCIKAHIILTQMLSKSESDIVIHSLTGGADPELAIYGGYTEFARLSYREALERLDHWVIYEKSKHEEIQAAAD